MDRTIITVVGKDTPGIIARLSDYLYKNSINILDISQTIVDGIFNMMMIVDTAQVEGKFEDIKKDLTALAKDLGVDIRCQREEIFEMMHRI